MNLATSRVLVTQAHLVRFMGSEMVTLEIVEYFASMGADVVVVTHTFGGDLREPFESLPNVRVFELPDPALAGLLRDWVPDLAWIHHTIIPDEILRNADRTAFVFNHMSAYLPIERSLAPHIELALASASAFNSEEARADQIASGLYDGFDDARLQTFENPAPAAYSSLPVSRPLRRLLVVSNHIPEELAAAVPVLRERVAVELVGSQRELGASPRLMTPEFLHEFDAVVSIGKTVQFAIAAGIPVYVYDHFGGPGWLTETNFELARRNGFSGRGFPSKSADAIARELIDGHAGAVVDYDELLTRYRADFVLPDRMRSLLEFVETHRREVMPPSERDRKVHANLLAAFGSYVREWVRMQGDAVSAQRQLTLLRRRFRGPLWIGRALRRVLSRTP